ncbi:Ala-tRNA(Pro) hydrolase [Methylobacterium tarhaniae]|uniref:Alanine--tRNA ligase n=1 Tax=Methylobacterium tarhaniae TaxID=1187852 RepID=A0A0J6SMQ4_9HYPH|nr:alanyl-tRNA editing protein [Methylobacterium tarhaniae]KMO34678.1 Ala-tRNA(Pro) hydrolase [Methylobacterium tarhaniae]
MNVIGDTNNPFSERVYWTDPYCKEGAARVVRHVGPDGIVLDRTIQYPEGGGQPGDTGILRFDQTESAVVATEEAPSGDVVLRLESTATRPSVGTLAEQGIDWERRYRHMRVHTALHLLTVVLPFPVIGGQVSAEKGRLDFRMPAPPASREELEERLNAMVARDAIIATEWIPAEVVDANPGLVKTQMVQPPAMAGRVRLVRIGSGETLIDLQPCGGTHVARTGEIGAIRLGKIENKGAGSRRVTIMVEARTG